MRPEHIAYSLSLSALLQVLPELGCDSIDIVFDHDVVDRRAARRAYTNIRKQWPAELPQRLARPEPHFEDDTQFLPLQAADLLAHCIRVHFDPGKSRYDRVRNSQVFAALRSIPTILCPMGNEIFSYLRARAEGRVERGAVPFKYEKWE